MVDEATQTTHTYLSTPNGTSLAALHVPLAAIPLTEAVIGHWQSWRVYTDLWNRKQFVAFVAALVEQGSTAPGPIRAARHLRSR